jgi:hypothetical protein
MFGMYWRFQVLKRLSLFIVLNIKIYARSALALRRHKDICRQCSYPPFGIPMRLLLSATSPLDQFAFVDSDDEDMQLTDKTGLFFFEKLY